MPFGYRHPPAGGRLVQGEVLRGLIEYVPLQAPVLLSPEGEPVHVIAVRREWVVVMAQDCDLLQDFNLRSPDGGYENLQPIDVDPRALPSVILCEAFEDLKSRVAGSDIFRRAKRNQDERYHALPESSVDGPERAGDTATAEAEPSATAMLQGEEGAKAELAAGAPRGGSRTRAENTGTGTHEKDLPEVIPALFLDFRKVLALPTRFMYEGLRAGGLTRAAVVPPIFMHDMVHRFYGYLSRVATDEA